MTSTKTNIVRLKSLSKKEIDIGRESVIKLSDTNPDQITIVIDNPKGGDINDVLQFGESIRLANCNVSSFAQGDLDLSGLLVLSALKRARGKRLFSSYLKTDLSGAKDLNPKSVEIAAEYISNHSDAEKAEVVEWIQSGKTLSSTLMKEKKLVDDLNTKRKRIVKIQAGKSVTNQSAVAVEKENVKNIIK